MTCYPSVHIESIPCKASTVYGLLTTIIESEVTCKRCLSYLNKDKKPVVKLIKYKTIKVKEKLHKGDHFTYRRFDN